MHSAGWLVTFSVPVHGALAYSTAHPQNRLQTRRDGTHQLGQAHQRGTLSQVSNRCFGVGNAQEGHSAVSVGHA